MNAIGVRRAGVRGSVLPVILLLTALLLPDIAAAAVLTERINIPSVGGQATGGYSQTPSMTPDGRYVVFSSTATNLVPGDTNDASDVFVRDRLTGATTRVSVATGGGQATDGHSYANSVSADGRLVAFQSGAGNLVAGDTNNKVDIFVHDRATGETRRVNLGPGSVQANGDSEHAALSADGQWIAYASSASNLVADDTNGQPDIFIRPMAGTITTRVSEAWGGVQATGPSGYPSISGDGNSIAFISWAPNLVHNDTNGLQDIFVHDRHTNTTDRVSLTNSNTQAEGGHAHTLSISGSGRFVAFSSSATNIVAGDTNGLADIFIRDRWAGRTTRVNLGPGGVQAQNGESHNPRLSTDGRYVTYHSEATNLVSGDTNNHVDMFVRDTLRGMTRRASVSTSGAQGNGGSYGGHVTWDGRRVSFFSAASNLVLGDTNGAEDVYMHTGPASVVRLSDRTRFSTAVAIARDAFPGWIGVKRIVIASGDDRAAADPLAASGLCWAYDAPMMLVSAARTPDEVKAAIKEIVTLEEPPIVLHVVGGPVSVPDARLNEIKAHVGAANVTIDRILTTGNRYDLAAAIALRMKSVAASNPSKTMTKAALFANGVDSAKFFDALALSPISAGTGAPILLVTATSVPPATASAVAQLAPTTKIVGGGPNTVSEAVSAQLGATRWSGRTRYDTAIAIAEGAVSRKWLTRSYVGLAAKLPDALTGGSLIGRRKGVLLLTDGAALTPVTQTWLTSHKWDVAEACLFGGPLSITEAVKTQVGNALQ